MRGFISSFAPSRGVLCRIRRQHRGVACLLLAILLQVLMPLAGGPASVGAAMTSPALADTLDPSSVCLTSVTTVPGQQALPDGTRHRDGMVCGYSHLCCQPPLSFGQIEVPPPCGTGWRLAASVPPAPPCTSARTRACARAPPVIS